MRRFIAKPSLRQQIGKVSGNAAAAAQSSLLGL
jgi:hypothetical protein